MPKTQYTVTEISKQLNVSRVTAYNRIKKLDKELRPFTKVVNNITYIEQQGLDILMGNIGDLQINTENLQDLNNINNDSVQDTQKPDSVNVVDVLSDSNKSLTKEIEYLKQQLQDKHEYINLFKDQLETKDKQIEGLNNSLNQSQKINENNQVLLREQKVLMLENQDQKEKGFWKRLFSN